MGKTIKRRFVKKGGTRKGNIIRAFRSILGIQKKTANTEPVPTREPSPKSPPREPSPAREPSPKSPPRKPSPAREPSPAPEDETIDIKDVNDIITATLKDEDTIKVPVTARKYLLKLITDNPADKIRQIDKETAEDLAGYEFDDKITDKKMLLRILKDVIEMSIHSTRDSGKKMVNKKIIDFVLDNDSNAYIKVLLK